MMMNDVMQKKSLGTEDGVELFLSTMLDFTRDRFLQRGELYPVCTMLINHDPFKGESYSSPEVRMVPIGDFLTDGRSKNVLTHMLRTLSVKSKADFIMVATETWVVVPDGRVNEIEAEELSKHGSLEHFEGRKEAISVFVESKYWPTTRMYMAFIERDSEGKPTLGVFERPPGDASMQGRFVGLLGRSEG